MSSPLLMTKLHIPRPQSGLVPRPRLIAHINQGLEHELTLISAPPGFGKTVVLEQWASGYGGRLAWLSLDEGDNDPTRFWSYAIAALQKVQVNFGEAPLALLVRLEQNLQPFPKEALCTAILNELALLPAETVLVMDDFHVIESLAIQDGLLFLVEHLPASCHIVLSSRMDPPLPLARLRARSMVTELRADDLRFTVEEAISFLNQSMGLGLTGEDIAQLDARTEGWIAGLKLAALSVQRDTDPSAFISSFTGRHRFVLDYLVEEVLRRQTQEIKTFLLKTSILHSFTAPLCDALTGSDDSQEMLERVQRSNLFVIPLDDERRWFRYHHLFADLLQSLLLKEAPKQLSDLHRRAADWLEQNGLVDDAVAHWIAGGDPNRAADLVEGAADHLFHKGQWNTLMRWTDALPEGLVRSRPNLFLYQTWVRALTGQNPSPESEKRLSETEEVVSGHPVPQTGSAATFASTDPVRYEKRLLGRVAAARAALLIFDMRDPERAIRSATRALQILPEKDTYWRAVAASCLAGAYQLSGDVLLAQQALAHTALTSQAAGDNYALLVQRWRQARLHIAQGELRPAAAMLRDALHEATDSAIQSLPASGYASVDLGDVLREWNDLDNAGQLITDGIARLQQDQRPVLALYGYVALSRLQAAKKEYNNALETLASFEAQVERRGRLAWLDARLASWKARIELMHGNLEAAAHWVDRQGLDNGEDPAYTKEPEHLSLVRVLIEQARISGSEPLAQQALDRLDRLLALADSQKRIASAIEIQMLRAQALNELEDAGGSLAALERAFSMAAPGGYLRVFLDEGQPMLELLSHCRSLRAQASHQSRKEKYLPGLAYFDRLMSAFSEDLPTAQGTPTGEGPSAGGLIEPLSAREMEVLRLVAAGHSTDQIAAELFISRGTVRNHLKSIYSKLGAHTRMQAVQLARELSVL